MEAQGIDRSVLPFRSRFAKFGAYYSIASPLLTQALLSCYRASFSSYPSSRLGPCSFRATGQHLISSYVVSWSYRVAAQAPQTNYLPLVLFPLMFLAKKLIGKTQWRKAHEMDCECLSAMGILAESPSHDRLD